MSCVPSQNVIQVSDEKGYSRVEKKCRELLEDNKYRKNDPTDKDPYSNKDFARLIHEVTPLPSPDSTVIDEEKMPGGAVHSDAASIATVTSTASGATVRGPINPADIQHALLLGRERVSNWDPLHEYTL